MKGKSICEKCKGQRLTVGLFSKVPCSDCNGAGFLFNGKAITQHDVIDGLIKENLALRNKVYLLTDGRESNQEQHTGVNQKTKYRGD